MFDRRGFIGAAMAAFFGREASIRAAKSARECPIQRTTVIETTTRKDLQNKCRAFVIEGADNGIGLLFILPPLGDTYEHFPGLYVVDKGGTEIDNNIWECVVRYA